MDQNDEDIMEDYQSGNHEVIEMIFTRYKNRIINFSLRMLGNRADAEDVTGDVFLALFKKKYTFDPKAKFSTWLFTIARNCCISRIRKRKNIVSIWFTHKDTGSVDQWEIEDTKESSSEALEGRENAVAVKAAIAKLPVEQRESIILREYHDMSYEQISQVLGCSMEKVKILIYRARERLRGELMSFIKEEE